MFLSRSVYSGDGSTRAFAVTFPYLSRSHVQVRVGGALLTQDVGYSWINSSSISFMTAPVIGENNVDIRRVTPNDTVQVTYTDGSTLLESDLNTENLHLLYLYQESFDDNASRMGVEDPSAVTFGDWDARNRRIKNVKSPISGGDAANMAWVQAMLAGVSAAGVGMPVVNSLAAIRSLTKTKVFNVFATGCSAAGDGGGGPYFLDQADNTSNDDGVTVIVSADGGRYKLQYTGNLTVKHAGAGAGADDTSLFSAVAKASKAGNSQALQNSSIPSSPWAAVEVPTGHYKLTDYVDGGGREVVWLVHPGAEIEGVEFLNGRITRLGSKTGDFHHGITDSAVTLALTANRRADEQAQVSGYSDPSVMSKGNGRDSVTLYVGNRAPSVLYGTPSVDHYASNGVYLSTPMITGQLRQMRAGMVIRTRHTPQAYQGIVKSWTSNFIEVSSWYLVDGSASGTPATPPGTAGLDVNAFRKAWGINANVFIDSDSAGNAINTMELGLQNTKGEPQSRSGAIEANGLYVSNLGKDGDGSFYGDAAYLASGRWSWGYKVNGGVTTAFAYDGSITPQGDSLSSLLYAKNLAGTPFYQIKGDGSVEAGLRGGGGGTVSLDMHSGTTDVDYDVRWQSSGGTGSVGGGTASIYASAVLLQASTTVDVYSKLRPSTDNTLPLGEVARRFSQVCAGTGSIVTSDGNEKTDIRELDENERAAAAKLKTLIRMYKLKNAVAEKGDAARWHCGIIAQDVETAFKDAGLDGFKYGVLCFDQWEDEFVEHPAEYTYTPAEYSTLLGEDGNPILIKAPTRVVTKEAWTEQVMTAGSRYGVRYDELYAFILSAS